MKVFKLTSTLIGLILAFGVYGQPDVSTKKLSVKISNIQNKGKTLYVGIYRAGDEFPEFNRFWKNTKVTTTSNEMTVEFEVPYGEYAVAVSHDLNGNEKLDKNFVGYPKEPFGFSNNFKPKFSSPKFSDCKFSFTQQSNSLTIKLID
ncbi:MAG: DUF2141 domain-containing protein [Cyclobacteriaceae bacterium]